MLFGIFSRCDSMGEVCDGMRVLSGKLNYLGMDSSPAKSTVGDALRDRDEQLFRRFYFVLTNRFSSFLSISRKKKYRKEGISFEEFYAFDSTLADYSFSPRNSQYIHSCYLFRTFLQI
jgi:hypothetical protein